MLVMALIVREAPIVTATSTVTNATPTAAFFATNATATLSGTNGYVEDILNGIEHTVYQATEMIVNFPDTVGKMKSASRSLMKHIEKDFVGFIQANLAPVYFYLDSFHQVAEFVGRWLEHSDPMEEFLRIFYLRLGVGYEYLYSMAWEKRMSLYLELFKGSIESVVSGIERALRDSHMDDVIGVIEEILKLLPLKDFNYFVHFLGEKVANIKCTEVLTKDVCGLHKLMQDSTFQKLYIRAWLPLAHDFIENLRDMCKDYEVLSSYLSSFIKNRLGEEFSAFLKTIYQKFKDFVLPGLVSVPVENFGTNNLAKESDGGSSDITSMGRKTRFVNKEVYSCDRYSPLCYFFQWTTKLIVDFPTTIKIAVTGVIEAASIFMKKVIEDFPGLVKNIDVLPYASIRYAVRFVSQYPAPFYELAGSNVAYLNRNQSIIVRGLDDRIVRSLVRTHQCQLCGS